MEAPIRRNVKGVNVGRNALTSFGDYSSAWSAAGVAGPTTAAEHVRQRLAPAKKETSGHLGRVVACLLVVSGFGPYVVGGLRTEQLAIYGLFVTVGFLRFASLQVVRLPARAWLLFGCWLLYAATGAVSGLGGAPATPWAPGDPISGLDNLAAPLGTLLVVWATVTAAGAQRTLELAAKVIALCVAANGVLAVVQSRVDMTTVLRPFWSFRLGTTTAQNALGNGRYCGVFNQPVEAGLAYSVAALCAWYVWRHRPRLLYPTLVLVVLGGLLSVSKIFILVGLPVLLFMLLAERRTRFTTVFVTIAAVFGVVQSGVLDQWFGVNQLVSIFHRSPGQGLLSQYTAGRLGSGSTLAAVYDEILRVSPWVGVGARGLAVPYDNAWIEALVVAGLVGAACYTAVLGVLLFSARKDHDTRRRWFATGLAVVVIGASFGVPALTANRAGTLVWVTVALLTVAGSAREYRQS